MAGKKTSVKKNDYTGETPVEIGGKTYSLIYDWRALAKLRSNYTKEQLQALPDQSPEALADMLVIGLERKHPNVTPDMILDLSPPVHAVAEAIDQAVLISYYGPKKAEEILEEMRKLQEAMNMPGSKKKA